MVIFDRDGLLNQDSPAYIKSPDELILFPESLAAVSRLCQAGWLCVVATNQSGIGRGYYDHLTLARMHRKLQVAALAYGGYFDFIAYCPHRPNEGCHCRKPQPGLLLQIAARYQCSLQQVPFLGDKDTDLLAAKAVGALAILVHPQPPAEWIALADRHFTTVPQAVAFLLSGSRAS